MLFKLFLIVNSSHRKGLDVVVINVLRILLPIFSILLFPLSDMYLQTLDGNLGFDEFFINKNKQFSFDL